MGLSFINCLITLESGLGNLDFNFKLGGQKVRDSEIVRASSHCKVTFFFMKVIVHGFLKFCWFVRMLFHG